MTVDHTIQKQILTRLMARPDGCRYRDMRPANIENDLYNYHLQQLVKLGLVGKYGNTYKLSPDGHRYILDIQPMDITGMVADKFKLAALALVLRETHDGLETLYQTRGYAPSAGSQQIIGGSIRKGELVTKAAQRRLREEAGLDAEFSYFGTIRKIRQDADGFPYSDITYHICFAINPTGKLIVDNVYGHHDWVPLRTLINNEHTLPIGSPRFANILEQLQNGSKLQPSTFYFEELIAEEVFTRHLSTFM